MANKRESLGGSNLPPFTETHSWVKILANDPPPTDPWRFLRGKISESLGSIEGHKSISLAYNILSCDPLNPSIRSESSEEIINAQYTVSELFNRLGISKMKNILINLHFERLLGDAFRTIAERDTATLDPKEQRKSENTKSNILDTVVGMARIDQTRHVAWGFVENISLTSIVDCFTRDLSTIDPQAQSQAAISNERAAEIFAWFAYDPRYQPLVIGELFRNDSKKVARIIQMSPNDLITKKNLEAEHIEQVRTDIIFSLYTSSQNESAQEHVIAFIGNKRIAEAIADFLQEEPTIDLRSKNPFLAGKFEENKNILLKTFLDLIESQNAEKIFYIITESPIMPALKSIKGRKIPFDAPLLSDEHFADSYEEVGKRADDLLEKISETAKANQQVN